MVKDDQFQVTCQVIDHYHFVLLAGVTRSLQVVSVVTGLISILFVLIVLLCIFGTSIVFYRCRHKYKQREQETPPKHKSDDIKEQPYMSAVFVRSQQTVKDAKGPDIITNTCCKFP